jgi:disulfide bond formation protein DsbB
MLLTASRSALLAGLFGLAIILMALVIQYGFGFEPCELCYKQRWPYYIGVPIALLLGLFGANLPPRVLALALLALTALFVYGCVLGGYHAGAEWHFWPGPTSCDVSAATGGDSVEGMMQAITQTKVISCTDPRLRIFGVSLAGWNAVVMAAMSLATLYGAGKALKSR